MKEFGERLNVILLLAQRRVSEGPGNPTARCEKATCRRRTVTNQANLRIGPHWWIVSGSHESSDFAEETRLGHTGTGIFGRTQDADSGGTGRHRPLGAWDPIRGR